jgi:hypothetical protein
MAQDRRQINVQVFSDALRNESCSYLIQQERRGRADVERSRCFGRHHQFHTLGTPSK